MKRIFASVLLACLLLPAFSLADEPFVLRGGLKLDMTKEEVMAVMEEEGLFPVDFPADIPMLMYRNVPVGNHVADSFTLDYNEDGLSLITYSFPKQSPEDSDVSDAMFSDLLNGLTAVYGAPDKISPYKTANWETADVFITLQLHQGIGETDESCCSIMYFAQEKANTNGL